MNQTISLQEFMNRNSTIVALPENVVKDKEYLFAKLNKNDSIKEYEHEVYEKEDYYKWNCRLTHLWIMHTYAAFKTLSTNLLTSFDQIKGLGGVNDDESIRAIGIVYDNKIIYVVDPQGYSYARYVGLRPFKGE